MAKEKYNNLDAILEGDSKELNVVESLIQILNTPIAKRKGIMITPEECAEWSNELKNFLKNTKVPVTINIEKMVRDYANNNERGNEEFGKPFNCMIRAYRMGLTDALSTLNLEKQGEQKEILCDKCKKAQPSHSCQDITALGRCAVKHGQNPAFYIPKFYVGDKLVSTKNPRLTYEVLEVGHTNELCNLEYKVEIFTYGKASNPRNIRYMECCKVDEWAKLIEQKSADKVEPKFKEGEWAVSNLDGKARQISEVHFDEYNSYYVVDGKSVNLEEYDRLHHLWSIADAKKGDVLMHNGCTFIFICIEKGVVKGLEENLCNGTETCNFGEPEYDNDYCPATKEQRDTMMKVMANAGYTFDFEKKELKKLEQKPTYKTEPKFKEGDWLVHNERRIIIKVVKSNPLLYKVVDTLGYHHTITDDAIESNYHIWTIQDAKDGDVVVEDSNISSHGSPFIAVFKTKDSEDDFSSHCFIGFDGHFYDGEVGHCSENIHPATKEQRDLLFQKMNEAGHEWDSENKELRKIEQKHAEWSEEDERMVKIIESTIKSSIKDVVAPAILGVVDNVAIGAGDVLNWLKSLKPQKYVGYNPYKATVESIAEMCKKYKGYVCAKEVVNDFLNNVSAKCREAAEYDKKYPQKQWKPSDLPHWKKSTLPNGNTTGFNSDYFCHKGYCINYKELFEKLPKDD